MLLFYRNTVQLVIHVEDVNDNAPQFLQNSYEARLLENEDNFDSPLVIEATDNDLNGKFIYYCIAIFEITTI